MMVPKRDRRFQISVYPLGAEDSVWGLQTELRVAFYMMIVWFGIICVGGLLFWIAWASVKPDEWSEAGIPLSVMATTLAAFYLPLHKYFDQTW